MAKSAPFLPLYVGDYMLGTHHLSPEARLVYCELLMVLWASGGRIPNDLRALRKLARAESWTPRKFRSAWEEIQGVGGPYEPKFLEDSAGLYNERLEAELLKTTGSSKKLSKSGRSGALIRWGCPACRAAGNPHERGRLSGSEKNCPDCGESFL